MRDRLTIAVLGLAVALVTAGCSDSTGGTPVAGSGTTVTSTKPDPPTQTSSGSEDRYGAPKVDKPLDASKYLTQPCLAISSGLLESLALPTDGKPDTEGAIGSRAPSCSWRAGPELASAGFLKANKNGLTDLYRGNASHPEAYWEETTVDGYPGVFHGTPDSRGAGQCALAVGLSEALAMLVLESGRLGTGSCDRAKKVAEAVIKTLKGQG